MGQVDPLPTSYYGSKQICVCKSIFVFNDVRNKYETNFCQDYFRSFSVGRAKWILSFYLGLGKK